MTISAAFGILATAGINGKWGTEIWNPWDLLDAIQDHHNHPAARFAIFCAAFCWTIGILGTNVAANMISFGSDVALLWPRYIDMKRGFFIAQALGFAIVPWKIMASASIFTTFLSGYGLFMASVVAIMLSDCKWSGISLVVSPADERDTDFIFTKGNILVSWLFNPKSSNAHYYYYKGWNVQAVIAYIAGIALPLPGFAVSLGASGVNLAGEEMFYIGWLLSFFTSFLVYTVLCYFWPTPNQRLIKEYGMGWEESENAELVGAGASNASHTSNSPPSYDEAGAPQLMTEIPGSSKEVAV